MDAGLFRAPAPGRQDRPRDSALPEALRRPPVVQDPGSEQMFYLLTNIEASSAAPKDLPAERGGGNVPRPRVSGSRGSDRLVSPTPKRASRGQMRLRRAREACIGGQMQL